MSNSYSETPTAYPALLSLRVYLLVAATLAVAFSFVCVYGRLHMPFEIDYEEGNILNTGLRILQGQTPYPPPGIFPYVINPYGPIGYVVSALGIKIFGLGLLGPRLLVLVSGIAVTVLLAFLVTRLGELPHVGAIAAISFACLPIVSYWLPLLRVDFVAIFFSLLGLYIFCRFPTAWPFVGFILGVGILTKQTALAVPTAIFIELIIRKQSARAFALIAVIVATVVSCAALLGKGFLFAFLRTHPDPYSFTRVFHSSIAAAHGCILLLATIAYAFAFGFRWTNISRIAWLYLAACTVTCLSSGKLGSNMNHFLEWSAGVCILAGLALCYLIQTRDLLARPFALGLLTLATVFAFMSERNFGVIHASQNGCMQAYAFIRDFPGDRVLSDDISALVLNKKPVLISNPFVVTELGQSVRWQAGTVEQMTRARYFDLIILGGTVESSIPGAGGWSTDVMHAIASGYVPVRYFQCPYAKVAYVPLDPGDSRESESFSMR